MDESIKEFCVYLANSHNLRYIKILNFKSPRLQTASHFSLVCNDLDPYLNPNKYILSA